MSAVEKVKTLSRKVEFEGWHSLETIVVQPPSLKHSGMSEPLSREVYMCGSVVIVLLYQPETDRVLLNEQFRIGAFIAGDKNPWLIECAAGMIDEGEEPEAAVHREALEETGSRILDLEFISKCYPSAGCSEETFLIYCGRIGEAEAGHYGLESEGEEIKTHLVPSDEAIRMLDEGEITNGATIICLHWFARHRDRLRKKWGHK